jgi:hypothetical protein
MNFKKEILVFLLVLAVSTGYAQQTKKLVENENTIKLFFEKSYLHTDRSYYSSGESIWYAAYLVNAKSTSLTATSNNLYVELISPGSEVLDRKLIRLEQGLGKGDFKLKDSLATGWYTLRSYTNWMRNFGDNFIFQKKIFILNTLSAGANTPFATSTKKRISVFPEGGSLVDGLPGIVAFKTTDENGEGVVANASVVTAKGDTITAFQATSAGIGIFAFTPNIGQQYKLVGTLGGEKFVTELPNVLSKGISLHTTTDSANLKLTINANGLMFQEFQNKTFTIAIKHAGDNIYTGTINLSKPNISISVPIKELASGIAVVTILDPLGRPQAERLVYLQTTNPVNLAITTNKSVYTAREQTIVNVKVTNSLGEPVKTSLSLAVVDGQVPDDGSDIVSYLMLQSEIKGDIKNPSQYFDPKNQSRFKQLDLLLLTQGWRDYIWKKNADSTVKVSYLPEPGITIRGSVREKIANKPLPGMNITLFGTSFTGDKIFTTKTDEKGNFFLDGLNWDGNQAIKLSSQDAKGKKGGWLQIDSVFKPFRVTANNGNKFAIPSGISSEINKRMAYNRTYKIDDEITLKEVNIVGGKSQKVEMFDQTLRTFGYPDQVFNITAADYSFKGLEHYLLTKVKGAQPVDVDDSVSNEGVMFLANGKKVRPRIVVNNQEDLMQRLDYYSLTMDQINQITVRHLVGNDQDNPGVGTKDFYVISLDLKDTALRGQTLHLLNVNLNGYYQARTFYSPNYKTDSTANKDLRTTIFWAPSVKTNDKGIATLSYYNGDNKTEVAVKASGISATGAAVASKTIYKVQ